MTSPPPQPNLAAAVAAWRIDSHLAAPVDPLDESRWGQLMNAVIAERLVGLLAWAIAEDEWPATDTQRSQVYELHRSWMASALHLESELLATASMFEEMNISFQVLKGTAVAHLDYPDASLRCFGDVDLLIPETDIEAARDALLNQGGRRAYPEPRPGFDRRFTKGLAITTESGVEIDLHRTLTAGPFGLAIDLPALRAHPDRFRVGGRSLDALGRPQRFFHTCVHALLGAARPRLVPLRDLVQSAPSSAEELDAVGRLAEASKSVAVVARAVAAAQSTLGWRAPDPLRTWAAQYREVRRDRRWLSCYLGENRSYALQSLMGVEAVGGGPRTRASYLHAVLLPINARRGEARRARWRRGTQALRSRLSHRH